MYHWYFQFGTILVKVHTIVYIVKYPHNAFHYQQPSLVSFFLVPIIIILFMGKTIISIFKYTVPIFQIPKVYFPQKYTKVCPLHIKVFSILTYTHAHVTHKENFPQFHIVICFMTHGCVLMIFQYFILKFLCTLVIPI